MQLPLMYIVLFVGLAAMIISSIPRERYKYGLETAWLLIFSFLAIRYDFGNDYMSYMDSFTWGVAFSDEIWGYREARELEAGWQLLSQIFKPFGFYVFVAAITAFECYVFYKFTKEYVPERYYWLAIFVFMFTPSIMLIGSSAMRQMLAVTIFLNSIKYIQNRRFFPYIISIFIATQFHSSAVILYPLYLVTYYRGRNIIANSFMIFIYVLLLYMSEHMVEVIEDVASFAGEEETVDYYIENMVSQIGGTGLGSISEVLVLGCLALTLHLRNDNNRLLFLMLIVGTFVNPFSSAVPMIGRFQYYFDTFGIACYPIMLKDDIVNSSRGLDIKRLGSTIALLIVLLTTIYEYVSFFASPIWIDKYSTYHTIFEAL